MTSSIRKAVAASVLVVFAIASRASAQKIDSEETARAACRAVDRFTPGPSATATAEDRRTYAADTLCIDYLYQLVNDEKDYDKARRCCLVRGDCQRELGILFANGWGVTRDFTAATYFLCRAEKEMAPAEQWGMLEHVRQMRAGIETGDLTYCGHVTSGNGQRFCAELSGNDAAAAAEKKLAAIRAALTPAARALFDALEKEAQAYADVESGYRAEGSRGGTAYAAIVVESQTAAYDEFIASAERYAGARAPAVAAADAARADTALNAAYREAVRTAEACPLCDPGDTGMRDRLRDAQRGWIRYRDAWQAFYRERWKGAADAAALGREIATALTISRTRELRQP
jgi:uncharacterized protein YecT (DUF1311 family)